VRHSIIVTLLVVVACVGVYAQESDTEEDMSQPWRVVFYPFTDENAATDISRYVSAGYLPVGYERDSDSFGVLLVRGTMDNLKGWVINEYSDWNALETDITNAINSGYVPMDISRFGDTLSVLWVEADTQISGWRISSCANTASDRNRTINSLQAQGFTLWGVSVYEGLAWMLLLNRPNAQRTGTISVFESDTAELQQGLRDAYNDGWLPNGMGVSEGSIYFCFAQ